jgi:hypothetical protein
VLGVRAASLGNRLKLSQTASVGHDLLFSYLLPTATGGFHVAYFARRQSAEAAGTSAPLSR